MTKKTKDKTPQTFVQILSIDLTIAAHAHREAFLQPAELAPIPMMLRDFAVLHPSASVAELFPYRPFKETFAPFTADCSIMSP